jgi:hypothetical protein
MTNEKKDNSLDSMLKGLNIMNEAQRMYNEGVEKFDICKIEADKIENIRERLVFWQKVKTEYLQSLNFTELYVSGHTGKRAETTGELWFDRLVSIEQSNLEYQCKILETKFEDIVAEGHVPEKIQKQVAWLYDIGIVEYLRTKTGNSSQNSIAEILKYGMTGGKAAILKALQRIEERGSNIISDYSDEFTERKRKYDLNKSDK